MNEYSYEKSTACDDVRVCELLIRRSASLHSGGLGRFLLSRPTPDCREGSFPLVARRGSWLSKFRSVDTANVEAVLDWKGEAKWKGVGLPGRVSYR